MDSHASKPPGPATPVLDAILTLAVFVLFIWIASDHVPSNDKFDIWFWAAVTSSCVTGVFWLGLQMFHAVQRAQRNAARK